MKVLRNSKVRIPRSLHYRSICIGVHLLLTFVKLYTVELLLILLELWKCFFLYFFYFLPSDKFDQFWAVNRRLMEPIGEQDGFKHIPIRSYNEVRKPIISQTNHNVNHLNGCYYKLHMKLFLHFTKTHLLHKS